LLLWKQVAASLIIEMQGQYGSATRQKRNKYVHRKNDHYTKDLNFPVSDRELLDSGFFTAEQLTQISQHHEADDVAKLAEELGRVDLQEEGKQTGKRLSMTEDAALLLLALLITQTKELMYSNVDKFFPTELIEHNTTVYRHSPSFEAALLEQGL